MVSALIITTGIDVVNGDILYPLTAARLSVSIRSVRHTVFPSDKKASVHAVFIIQFPAAVG